MRNLWVVSNTWQTSANILTLPALPTAIYLVVSGESVWWLVVSFVVYMLLHGSIVLGCHMLLTHRAFTTSVFWERVLALVATLSFQGSPPAWAHAHLLHHQHADTDQDSHLVSWRFFLVKDFRSSNSRPSKIVVDLMRQPYYRFLHFYGAALCLLAAAVLWCVDYRLFLFAYAVPVSYTFLAVACSLVLLHRGGEPRSVAWFIPFFPAGEWFHKEHHEYATDWKRSGWSLVYYFIPLIQTDK